MYFIMNVSLLHFLADFLPVVLRILIHFSVILGKYVSAGIVQCYFVEYQNIEWGFSQPLSKEGCQVVLF